MCAREASARREGCGGAPAESPKIMVLGWQDHPCWPLRHNAQRVLAAARAEARAGQLVRGDGPRAYRHVLFPTDLSPASLDSLRRALALLPRSRFTLLHDCRVAGAGAMRTAGVGDATLDACRRRIERNARAAGQRFIEQALGTAPPASRAVQFVVLAPRQPRAPALAAHAADARPDLLVLPDVDDGWLRAWRLRADLRTLLRLTRCDLMLLPGAADAKCAARRARFVT